MEPGELVPAGRARVLLVEDDPELVVMLAGLLGEEGYHVEIAADGQLRCTWA